MLIDLADQSGLWIIFDWSLKFRCLRPCNTLELSPDDVVLEDGRVPGCWQHCCYQTCPGKCNSHTGNTVVIKPDQVDVYYAGNTVVIKPAKVNISCAGNTVVILRREIYVVLATLLLSCPGKFILCWQHCCYQTCRSNFSHARIHCFKFLSKSMLTTLLQESQ